MMWKVSIVLAFVAVAAVARADVPDVLSSDEIRGGMQRILERDQALHGGWFLFWDAKLAKIWKLKLSSVHDRAAYIDSPVARRMLAEHGIAPRTRAEEVVYFACNNFVSDEGTPVDVDVWMARSGDKLAPIQFLVHKVSGKPRYAFKNDEVVPTDALTE